jgi:predicted dehydrogenase
VRREYDWIFQRAKGIHFDCGVHAFDLFRWFAASEVTRIDARGTCHVDNPYPDAATAILEFANGVKAVYDHGELLYYDPIMPSRSFFRILVSGTDGSIVWGLGEGRGQRSVLRVYTAGRCEEEKFPIYGKERATQYRQFVESVRGGTLAGYFPVPEDAAKATELADAVVKTAMEHLIVSPVRRGSAIARCAGLV